MSLSMYLFLPIQLMSYSDYYGATGYGINALLVRRQGEDGENEMKEDGEDLSDVDVVSGLQQVVDWVKQQNSA